ncbi:sulfite exporter TauE/SafE family protein [Spongiibacter taiwanensis]|uniref:sulfite exporter TauE/SafE family protein n=1 Tax=Spongiibacter taiwanensis TaxID=1748242 RepID=UPI002036582E|nr:sulfite exporter TauE/SafE family protein [Spongiibacter taiwanensis]USA42799.1 sulfite exporter TauE/SafE family protein [Spongiibacter taiwanensis]
MAIEVYLSSPAFWALALVGLTLTGISKSGFAGGAGVLAVPLLALVMPVSQAVALCLPLLLVMDAKAVHYYWRDVDWPTLKKLIPAAVVGIAAGGLLFGLLPDNALLIGLGLLCLLFGLWTHLLKHLAALPRASYLWGSLSGLTSTLVHAGGPPLNIYLLSLAMPKRRWLATAAMFFAAMNLIKIVPYAINGQWHAELLWLSLLLIPVAVFGVWLGYQIQRKLDEARFMQICRLLLLGSGLVLIGKALGGA